MASKPKGSPKSRADHMARVVKHTTQTETGKSFGKSQSTVSRTLRRGYTKEGQAK